MVKPIVYLPSHVMLGLDRTFLSRGWVVLRDWDMKEKERKIDLVCFTGGEDINPFLYGEEPHSTTRYNKARDELEIDVFHKYNGNTPIAGVCRGGQLVNVLNGGRLWQHVNNHSGNHEMITINGRRIMVSSVHHQMMRTPKDNTGVVIGWTMRSTLKQNDSGCISLVEPSIRNNVNTENDIDAEEVVFPSKRHLCVQYHPEFGPAECEDRFFELVDKYCMKEGRVE